MILIEILGVIIWGSVWGWATNRIIANKGYDENWFWWGFFFGFIALLIALTKPECVSYESTASRTSYGSSFKTETGCIMFADGSWKCTCGAVNSAEKKQCVCGNWRCTCGRLNPGYTFSCTCGRSKQQQTAPQDVKQIESASGTNAPETVQSPEEAKEQETVQRPEHDITEALAQLKKLYDAELITEEEYKNKKAELLAKL